MDNSILNSIKKMLGLTEEYEHFDMDLIMHINSVFMILNQIGVGPPKGFSITDACATWDDYLPNNPNIQAVKSYMYMKVKLMFDPPLSSAALDSINRMISELEWRINVMAEAGELVNKEFEELKDRVDTMEAALNQRVTKVEVTVEEHTDLFKTLVGDET